MTIPSSKLHASITGYQVGMNKQRYKTPTMARPIRIAYAAYANTGRRNHNFSGGGILSK